MTLDLFLHELEAKLINKRFLPIMIHLKDLRNHASHGYML